MKKISYTFDENNIIQPFDEQNSGEHKTEISNALFDKVFSINSVPLKLNDKNKIVEDVELTKKFNKIEELDTNLKNSESDVIRAMEYKLDDETDNKVPDDLQAILDQRKEWQKELDELNGL